MRPELSAQSSPAIDPKSQKQAGQDSPGAGLPSLYGASRGRILERSQAKPFPVVSALFLNAPHQEKTGRQGITSQPDPPNIGPF